MAFELYSCAYDIDGLGQERRNSIGATSFLY